MFEIIEGLDIAYCSTIKYEFLFVVLYFGIFAFEISFFNLKIASDLNLKSYPFLITVEIQGSYSLSAGKIYSKSIIRSYVNKGRSFCYQIAV